MLERSKRSRLKFMAMRVFQLAIWTKATIGHGFAVHGRRRFCKRRFKFSTNLWMLSNIVCQTPSTEPRITTKKNCYRNSILRLHKYRLDLLVLSSPPQSVLDSVTLHRDSPFPTAYRYWPSHIFLLPQIRKIPVRTMAPTTRLPDRKIYHVFFSSAIPPPPLCPPPAHQSAFTSTEAKLLIGTATKMSFSFNCHLALVATDTLVLVT